MRDKIKQIKHEFTEIFNSSQGVYLLLSLFLSACYLITRNFERVALCTNECRLLATEDLHVN